MSFEHRLTQSQSALTAHTALLISDPLDIFYLTGFICLTPEEREAFLLLTNHSATLFLSSFSEKIQLKQLTTHIGGIERLLTEKLIGILSDHHIKTFELDGNATRVTELEFLKSILPKDTAIITHKKSPLETQRMSKDETEIEALTLANHLTHQALDFTFTQLQVGMTELEVQDIFEQELRKHRVKQFAFPTIVCFGEHSALPHHQPSETKLKENQAVLIDCGAKWHGYCADVTRTIWFGDTPNPEFSQIELIVKVAYQKVVDALENQEDTSPVTAATLDTIARDYIAAKGFGPQFIHTTGHGVGLYIHEQPSLNTRNPTTIKPGMVITIEPGIYLEGKFGYRFENSVLITQTGFQELL